MPAVPHQPLCPPFAGGEGLVCPAMGNCRRGAPGRTIPTEDGRSSTIRELASTTLLAPRLPRCRHRSPARPHRGQLHPIPSGRIQRAIAPLDPEDAPSWPYPPKGKTANARVVIGHLDVARYLKSCRDDCPLLVVVVPRPSRGSRRAFRPYQARKRPTRSKANRSGFHGHGTLSRSQLLHASIAMIGSVHQDDGLAVPIGERGNLVHGDGCQNSCSEWLPLRQYSAWVALA